MSRAQCVKEIIDSGARAASADAAARFSAATARASAAIEAYDRIRPFLPKGDPSLKSIANLDQKICAALDDCDATEAMVRNYAKAVYDESLAAANRIPDDDQSLDAESEYTTPRILSHRCEPGLEVRTRGGPDALSGALVLDCPRDAAESESELVAASPRRRCGVTVAPGRAAAAG